MKVHFLKRLPFAQWEIELHFIKIYSLRGTFNTVQCQILGNTKKIPRESENVSKINQSVPLIERHPISTKVLTK